MHGCQIISFSHLLLVFLLLLTVTFVHPLTDGNLWSSVRSRSLTQHEENTTRVEAASCSCDDDGDIRLNTHLTTKHPD